MTVTISGIIPEFSGLLVPVLGAATAMLVVFRRRMRQRTSGDGLLTAPWPPGPSKQAR